MKWMLKIGAGMDMHIACLVALLIPWSALAQNDAAVSPSSYGYPNPYSYGPVALSINNPFVTVISGAASTWDWDLIPPAQPVQPNPIALGQQGQLTYGVNVRKNPNGVSPQGTYTIQTTVMIRSNTVGYGVLMSDVGATLQGPNFAPANMASSSCTPANQLPPGYGSQMSCTVIFTNVVLTGQVTGSSTASQITFTGYTLTPYATWAPDPGTTATGVKPPPGGQVSGFQVPVAIPQSGTDDCATLTQVFDAGGAVPRSVNTAFTGPTFQDVSGIGAPVLFNPTKVCDTSSLSWTANFVFSSVDCQGTQDPSHERQILSNFKLDKPQVQGRYQDPLWFNLMTNVAYISCVNAAAAAGGGGSLTLARTRGDYNMVLNRASEAIQQTLYPELMSAKWKQVLVVEHQGLASTSTQSYLWRVSSSSATPVNLVMNSPSATATATFQSSYSRTGPFPSAELRGTVVVVNPNLQKGYVTQVEVLPLLTNGATLTKVKASCPLTAVKGYKEQFVELPAAAAASGMGSNKQGAKGVRCSYTVSVPPSAEAVQLKGLTTVVALVNGTSLNSTVTASQLSQSRGFTATKSSLTLGQCATVSEAFAGLQPVKLLAIKGSSTGVQGGDLPAKQPVSICSDAKFIYTARFGGGGYSNLSTLACGKYKVSASASAYATNGSQPSSLRSTSLQLEVKGCSTPLPPATSVAGAAAAARAQPPTGAPTQAHKAVAATPGKAVAATPPGVAAVATWSSSAPVPAPGPAPAPPQLHVPRLKVLPIPKLIEHLLSQLGPRPSKP